MSGVFGYVIDSRPSLAGGTDKERQSGVQNIFEVEIVKTPFPIALDEPTDPMRGLVN